MQNNILISATNHLISVIALKMINFVQPAQICKGGPLRTPKDLCSLEAAPFSYRRKKYCNSFKVGNTNL